MVKRTCITACLLLLGANAAMAQVSAQSRVRTFWEIFTRADANGKALAFDVLDPADDPIVIRTCYKALDAPHPMVMAGAVDFLTGTTGEKALEELVQKGLAHRNPFVRYAAVSALSDSRRQPRPLEKLLPALDDGSWLVRWASVDGLAGRLFRDGFDALASKVEDEDPRVRVSACLALKKIDDLKYVPQVLKALEDPHWQVRSAAIDAIWKLRPRAAVEPLIERFGKEKGRLQLEAHRVLVSLTGKDFGMSSDAWQDWWLTRLKKHGAKGRLEPEYSRYVIKPQKTVTRKFFNILTNSKRIVFVLDVSDSMNRYAKPLRPMKGVRPGGTTTRFEILKAELMFCLSGFTEEDWFNIFLFGTRVHAWKPALVQATPHNRDAAISFVRGRSLSGETNLYDALALAFGVPEKTLSSWRGYFDEIAGGKRAGRFKEGPEAIFLLSDGVPNRGAITDAGKIVREITRANRVRRINIHTIAVGRFHADFLRTLAMDNGGQAVTVGEGGVR